MSTVRVIVVTITKHSESAFINCVYDSIIKDLVLQIVE